MNQVPFDCSVPQNVCAVEHVNHGWRGGVKDEYVWSEREGRGTCSSPLSLVSSGRETAAIVSPKVVKVVVTGPAYGRY
jgi:hypothetical protein